MKSQWSDLEAESYKNNPVQMRAYTSRLLGREPSLVLHGGGNTSVKAKVSNLFGESIDVLYVKGSGWDLATIEPQGFAPVRMDVLLKLARLEKLSDTDMVREQKSAMLDPSAPGPSVEAILHAIIPFQFVEHTHADAVVAITNTPNGESLIRQLYGKRVLYVPYVMPGFILARKIFELTRDVAWDEIEGMVLLNHGVFTFSNDAKVAYEKMISLVTEAEEFLASKGANKIAGSKLSNEKLPIEAARTLTPSDVLALAQLRREVSKSYGAPLVSKLNLSDEAFGFSSLPSVSAIATRGTLTPDHVIHTKPKPLVWTGDTTKDVSEYVDDYRKYFERNKFDGLTMLDVAPRWAVWHGKGLISFGPSYKNASVVGDVSRHTIRAIQWSENLGGWKPLDEARLFEVEYWELEQAKVKKKGDKLPLQGKIALVTGASSGIGFSTAKALQSQGASVIALDINPSVCETFKSSSALGLICDMGNSGEIKSAIEKGIAHFGGLDILVSNAGNFPAGKFIADLPEEDWDKSLAINLTSHERLIKFAVPYLKLGFDPSIVIIASKNVLAPGPGAAAYSVAKAGLTQLARVAALELASDGIRVNVLHPDAVFDTAIWTNEILENRAKHYGMTVDQYKRKNLLRTEVTSQDVATMVCAFAGSAFGKTTGAQIPIDGGNDRVI